MIYLFSSCLVAAGQVLAIILFFWHKEPDCFIRRLGRIPLTAAFFLLQWILQAVLYDYVNRNIVGSLPALPYIFTTLIYYLIFVRCWSGLSWPVCGFLSLIFMLIDNCIWPMLTGISRSVWGISYLYEGADVLRLLFILMLWCLEGGLMIVIRRLLPPLEKIRLDWYNAILMISFMIPFLYIRVFSSRLTMQSNKTLQILMTACCLVSLITLTGGMGKNSQERDKMEAARMRYILERQQMQFQQKLEHIDEVNRKYHDMKNIFLYLETHSGREEVQSQVQKLLDEIRPYETCIATGNEAIDILLNEKLAVCQQKKITCVPYVDGTMLDFVEPMDLCTIFGNALDNAIESSSQIPEESDRQISIRVTKKGNSVALTFRNTYAKCPKITGGLPATTKEDKKNHGYGLGNIRYVMDKYHGELNCRIEGEEFVLTLLFMKSG